MYYKKIYAFQIYLENPGWLPPAGFKTGLKLPGSDLPVNISILGKKNSGSIIGTGFFAKTNNYDSNKQVWRMDYHKIYPKSSKDVALLQDAPFHYHILDPWQQ